MTTTADNATPTVTGPTVRRTAWIAVALAVFASAWGGNEFTPLLVMYRETGNFGAVAVDALLFLYVVGIVPSLLIGGPLSDRYGRRPLMLPAPCLLYTSDAADDCSIV